MASRLMFSCASGSLRQNRRRRALKGSASLLALCLATPPLLLTASPAPAQTVTTSGDVSPNNPTSASPWTTGDVIVGNTGAGSLTIEGGGVANTGAVRLGFNANSTGTVTVTGSGSTLTSSSFLYVGWFRGQGTLTVTNGATVNATDSIFIGNAFLDNTVTVSGRGTTVTTSEIDVGFLGSGKLTIADGAAVNAGVVIIGSVMSTATGTMTISGNGSTLTADSIYIGSFGSGTLTIADGAVVNATSLTLTEDPASTGTLNIGAAAGSAATAPGTLNTPSISFGDTNGVGPGTIVFNHTSSNYLFAPTISGPGTVNVLAGTTIFTADSTYTGATSIAPGAILQLGNGGTTGSIVTDVADNGTLIFNRSDTLAYGGVVSGSGNLVQNGSGTLVLTGINAYTGGTLLNSGTLSVGNDSAIGTGTLAMAEGTTLDFAVTGMTLANAITVSGDPTINVSSGFTDTISGTIADGSSPGDIVKTGAGTLILTGTNTYTGGTTISAGTLQLGDGGTTGSIVGSIVDNAALVINRSNALTLVGAISGTGTVSQVGTGTTTLAGVNTYSGGTTISAGTLVGSATSFGTGAIVDNAALVVDQTSNGTFNNVLSGTGTLTTTAGPTLTFASDSSAFTGTTDVAAGTLSVTGSLAGSAVTVESGATLAGSGTVGATTLLAGSTISPGVGGIGTLSINGNYAQASGATYVVQVGPTSTSISDRIAVTGAATIASGAVLDVVKATAGSYSLGTKYAVLTTTTGVTGAYTVTGATDVSAFISLGALYDARNVYLVTTQSRSLTDAAVTPNQIATAQGLQSAPTTNTALTAVLNQQSDAAARYALDPLSGEIHASIKGQMLNDSRFARNAVLDRLRDTFCSVEAPTGANKKRVTGQATQVSGGGCEINPDRITAWGSAFGAWGRTDGDGNAAALNRSIGGFVVGADARVLDTWRVGLMAGYDRSSFTARDRSSSGSSDDYHLGLYGGTQWGQLALRLGSAYTWHDIDTSRMVSFIGLADSLKGSYNAGTAQAFAELGYRIDVARVAFEPFASLAYVNLRTDGFTESGGQAALTSRGASTDATFTTLGLHTASNVDLGGAPVTVKATLGWRHAFGETTPSSTFIFSEGGAFTVSGVPIAKNAAVAETGLAVAMAANAVLGVSYGGQFGSSAVDQSVRGNLTVRF